MTRLERLLSGLVRGADALTSSQLERVMDVVKEITVELERVAADSVAKATAAGVLHGFAEGAKAVRENDARLDAMAKDLPS